MRRRVSYKKQKLSPLSVAKTFENVFVSTYDIRPSALDLDKTNPTQIGMDSLDALDAIITLENEFAIRLPDQIEVALVNRPIINILNACTHQLAQDKRLTQNEEMLVNTQYKHLAGWQSLQTKTR